MGANFLLYSLPEFKITEDRDQQLRQCIEALTEADFQCSSAARDETHLDLKSWRVDLLEALHKFPELTDCRLVTVFEGYFLTGGKSEGDYPNDEVAPYFDVLSNCDPVADLMEQFSAEDEAAARAKEMGRPRHDRPQYRLVAGRDLPDLDDGWAVYSLAMDADNDTEWNLVAVVDTETLGETLIQACGGVRVETESERRS